MLDAFHRGAGAAFIAAMILAGPAEASYCKTLKGEMVGFGEQTTRKDAEAVLSRAIAEWEAKAGRKAQPKRRKTVCGDYIKFLGEFECKAEAVVCR
jgi:hypothetical protein